VARVRLENIVWDAREPQRLGRFWAAAVGAELITDEPDAVEARLRLTGDYFLDLCFPRVAAPSTSPARLGIDLTGGTRNEDLHDPEGNPYRALVAAAGPSATGPIAALRLDSADPDRDAAFWAEITGWVPLAGGATTLRHPSGVGPSFELRQEPQPKRGKNRLHLDVRREAGDGDLVDHLPQRGATPLSRPDDHPWLVFADPSGNEFCVLAEPECRPSST
jgi:hypothetical protein